MGQTKSMKNNLESNQIRSLIQIIGDADNYREMIQHLLTYWSTNLPNFSIQKIANEGGMKSKSTIMDLKSGRRAISPKTYPYIERAFRIPEDLKQLFKLKFALECERLEPNYTPEEVKTLYDNNRNMLIERYANEDTTQNIFAKRIWPIVFAALDHEQGQTLEQIFKKTSISKLELRQTLDELIHKKFVIKKDNLYKIEQKSLSKLKQAHNKGFQDFYTSSLEHSLKLAKESFEDQKNIFASANLCIKHSDISYIRQRFNQLLSELINELDSPKGDHVSTICLSMFHE